MGAELEAYQNLSVDYFYMGEMTKANFYDEKFQLGLFEGHDSVVRKVAVGIIKNQIENIRAGRTKEKYVNGKFVKTSFDRMPSPSTFGGGMKIRASNADMNDRRPVYENINKADYENVERTQKPFADFQRPELRHLNNPANKDYLKNPKNIKFERKPKEIA
mmetsp:Transcript_30832/g.40957  ORF Transcript_30832/g.40957 Transcript_30832/m.40957 type:complete len:161 (-) Transcript_30832:486-968(-)|eukprot:CAMPEP_0185598862 /NCGR_PEP_ID=MMETSP0434-20130131/82291_1 /TAXON_ID=626734 ORGANISM="Favella taraikaensis, Strain Fe Narragansett Bay" /NCGR_SAMPLE_ID=MMETSP0434 /ASSEMBLY_ACC=CAM_ASM_000379 /LENGTH=160 /DNA_ID=CAMNT_0028228011 /DNA_START=611 /DNA_END=1093 /DNA_ORIENTATION=-